MPAETEKRRRKRLGFGGSVRLAAKIAVGSLRLVARYPILVLPMVPVFIMALLTTMAISYVDTWLGFMVILMAIFAAAAGLMISFGITGQMLKQLHDGRNPSLAEAALSRDMTRMIPRVLGLSAIWYSAVLVLVTIEMIIRGILDRISEDLGDAVVSAIFGTIADALRMMGFMMVAIMTFEDVGLRPAFRRLKAVVKDQAIVAVGGLVLTKLVTGLVVLVLYVVSELLDSFAPAAASFLLFVPVLALGWLLAMYLEQLFVTGLYLYSTVPDSPVVTILLQDVIGHELPEPVLAGEAVT